jgi:hypothetical protein
VLDTAARAAADVPQIHLEKLNMNASAKMVSAQRLNHVEFVHRPGERSLVRALFDLLGFATMETNGGRYVMGIIDAGESGADNFIAGREVRGEQWAFDQDLAAALTQEPLASSLTGYRQMLLNKPQDGMHFGIRVDTATQWEEIVARVEAVERHAPELAGRVRLERAFRPGDPDHEFSLWQAFVWTDVISTGSLAFGQQIELQTTG